MYYPLSTSFTDLAFGGTLFTISLQVFEIPNSPDIFQHNTENAAATSRNKYIRSTSRTGQTRGVDPPQAA